MSLNGAHNGAIPGRYYLSKDVPEPILARVSEMIKLGYPIFKIERCMQVHRRRHFYKELQRQMTIAFEDAQLIPSKSVVAIPFSSMNERDRYALDSLGLSSFYLPHKEDDKLEDKVYETDEERINAGLLE